MPAGLSAVAGCLNPDQPYAWVIEKTHEKCQLRRPTDPGSYTCLHADDSLSESRMVGKRMRSGRSTKSNGKVLSALTANASLMASLSVFESEPRRLAPAAIASGPAFSA